MPFTTQSTATFCNTAVYGQNPATTFTPACSGTAEVIANNARGGEYALVNILPGKQYTFSSSVVADHITITNNAGNALLVHGISPLTWDSGSNAGVVRYYLHTDSFCSFENANRVRLISCQNTLNNTTQVKNQFTVYPNPTRSIVNITGPVSPAKLMIVNALGQIVGLHHLQNGQGSVDLSLLPAGVYFLQISSAEGTQTVKVIRE